MSLMAMCEARRIVFAGTSTRLRSHLWITVLILLLPCSVYTCDAAVIISGRQYFIKHVEGRKGCADEGSSAFIGYLNKTCNAGATGSAYAPIVGPLLRTGSAGTSWRQFTLKKVGRSAQGKDLVEIETYYPKSSKKPLCQGFVVPEKKDACNVEPLADKVHIHAKKGEVWALSAVKGEKDTFTIRSYSRKPGCLKYLSVSATCSETYLQLDAKDDGSGRQHWTIIPAKASPPPPPRRKAPPLPPKVVDVPAVNYSIALTGYTSSFGSSERTAFCDSILSSRTYRQDAMNCIVAFVTDVPFQVKSTSRRLMQGSVVYVRGYTAFKFVYGDVDSQNQAGDAADDLYKDMASQSSLKNIFNSSFPFSTIYPDAVERGEVQVPQSTLPTTPSSPSTSPSPSSPTPSSPSPTPSAPTLSPDFYTVPGVITDGPITLSPAPSAGGGGGGGPTTTVPGIPTIGVFTVNTGSVGASDATWTAPASNNGATAVATYDIKCQDSALPSNVITASSLSAASVCTGASCNYVMTGFTTGTYTCSVRATNSAGSSPYSASGSFLIYAIAGLGSGSANKNYYGYAIDVSGDGSTAVIGSGKGNVVYVVERTGAASWGTPLLLGNAVDEYYGQSVAVNGDGSTIIVGAYGYSVELGKVYVYTKVSPATWTLSTYFTGLDANANFGRSVDVSSDGHTIAVGAPGSIYTSPASGNVYVITYNTGLNSWSAITNVAGGNANAKKCGYSVAISDSGNTIVMGCFNDAGEAYVMEGSGLTWGSPVALAQYTPSALASNDQFGASVSVSQDGSVVIVGAYTSSSGTGEAYVFTRSGISWSSNAPSCIALGALVSPPLSGPCLFGISVGVSGTGNTLAVGAPLISSGTGRIFVFYKSGTSWTPQEDNAFGISPTLGLGTSTSLSNDAKTLVAGAASTDSSKGEAFAYMI